MYAKTYSAVLHGLDAQIIDVEIDVSKGLPAFGLVGLPDKSITEAKDRVSVAMKSSDFTLPPKRILVNLAPADIRKEGPQMDLAMAAGLMLNCGYLHCEEDLLRDFCFISELSLTGELKPVRGVLPMVLAATERKLKYIVVAEENLFEAQLAALNHDIQVVCVKDLIELKKFLEAVDLNDSKLASRNIAPRLEEKNLQVKYANRSEKDFSDVIGQNHAKRALEIAAAGGHHVLMIGAPGCGKSMLAKRFKDILPTLSFDKALEVTKVYSISSLLEGEFSFESPFRSPHSSATSTSLVGGGVPIRPGEVSLAHNGVLFLDEFTECKRSVIEQLRQIMDDKSVTVNKGNKSYTYPADFILVAACNPCPCGYLGDQYKACSCTNTQIQRYLSKLSGPLLDRIDIHLELGRLSQEELHALGETYKPAGESSLSDKMRSNIIKAQEFANYLVKGILPKEHKALDFSLPSFKFLLNLDKETKEFLHEAVLNLSLSARSYEKVVRVARTIANLSQSELIKLEHVAEALQFRAVDFDNFRQLPEERLLGRL